MIGRIYNWLFDTHRHDWETIKEQPFTHFKYSLVTNERYDCGGGTLYTLRCKICGQISSKQIGLKYND